MPQSLALSALIQDKYVDVRAVYDAVEHIDDLGDPVTDQIQVKLVAHFVELGYKPDQVGQDEPEHLVCDVVVGGTAETFVEGD